MPSGKLTILFLCLAGLILMSWIVGASVLATATPVDEPDGLRLPAGFHAAVVAEALGPIRHLAVRGNGDIYISTPRDQQGNGKGAGIIALHLDAANREDQVQHFGSVDGGTGIRFFNGALYASSPFGHLSLHFQWQRAGTVEGTGYHRRWHAGRPSWLQPREPSDRI